MKSSNSLKIQDALYGEIEICQEIYELIKCPLVQRLRQVRLSNIDSICMPGIANISRYEHSVGVAYLASQVGFQDSISPRDRLIVQAAGLIHDTAITPFGHLAEEALNYLGENYAHEAKWSVLFGSSDVKELGGIDLQVYLGRESGLRPWANNTFSIHAERILNEILDALMGKGKYGQCIAGEIDLDNLDNVTRIAFHMGLEVDRKLPLRIAQSIERVEGTIGPIFTDQSVNSITQWLQLREDVYNKLMLSRDDFCGKVMLIYSSVLAFEREYLTPTDWILTDSDFIQRLLDRSDKEIKDTVSRWLLGDLWSLSELFWLEGQPADFNQTYTFAKVISEALGRRCFAYRIKDKRNRKLSVNLASGELLSLGESPTKWLLGVASPIRKDFSSNENKRIASIAEEFFKTHFLGYSRVAESYATLFEVYNS
jgi:HD superfamily phosphohydrolase